MDKADRILKFLEYAGPGGASGHDIGEVCHISTVSLYPLLAHMEQDGRLASEFIQTKIAKPRPRYYRLSVYKNSRLNANV